MRPEVIEIIKTRRSTRKYDARQVPEEILSEILEAGRYAPSSRNAQNAHFLVITNTEIRDRIGDIVRSSIAKFEETEDMYMFLRNAVRLSKKGKFRFHYNAPVLVLAAAPENADNAVIDCAVALENMMIAANAMDLASCWVNQIAWLCGTEEEKELNDLLISIGMKKGEKVFGAVVLGYAGTEDGLPLREPLPRTGNVITRI